MPMVPNELADQINDAIGATDKDDKAIKTTPNMKALANAVVATLKASAASHLPGTVTGTAPPAPGPVADLSAKNGTFLPPLTPTLWISTTLAVNPLADPSIVMKIANGSVTYLQSNAKITFSTGTMQGVSTAVPGPPPVPGILTAGTGTGGKIEKLKGADWANLVAGPKADKKLVEDTFTVIADYIMENATVFYPPGSVLGSFPAPGAPLAAGVATGGIIS